MTTITIIGMLPSLNDYINAERRNRFMAAKMKKDAQTAVLWQLKGLQPITELSFYHFEWSIHNQRKDPDNISAFGRKVIFDAMQVAGVLPNDNLKYIVGTADTYVMAEEPSVTIHQIPLTELNGYVTVPVVKLHKHENKRLTGQIISDKSHSPK